MMYSILRPMFNALSDCKIAPSDLAAEYTFGEKCFRNGSVKKLNNGIDLSVYKFDEKARKAIRNEYEITEDTEVLGHIGRFNQQKNHIFLIDIFNNYHKMKPNSKLLLVGNGELIEKVHKYVKNLGLDEYVIFAGIKKIFRKYCRQWIALFYHHFMKECLIRLLKHRQQDFRVLFQIQLHVKQILQA